MLSSAHARRNGIVFSRLLFVHGVKARPAGCSLRFPDGRGVGPGGARATATTARKLVETHVAKPAGPATTPTDTSTDRAVDKKTFPGFDCAQMKVIRAMAGQIRRNCAFSLLEAGVVLVCLLATSQHENSFEVTERSLYIACCVSNAFCLGFASEHFQEIEQDDARGFGLLLAGIQDLNALFSNITFVVMLRGLVQCMEAGIAKPDLIVWLQGWGACAAIARLAVVQRLVDNSRLRRQLQQPGADAVAPAPVADPAASVAAAITKPRAQAIVLTSPMGKVLASRQSGGYDADDEGPPEAVDASGADSLSPRAPAAHSLVPPEELFAFGGEPNGLQHSILGSCGFSVEDVDVDLAEGLPKEDQEYEVTGAELKVLVTNMDQLQWAAVSMLLLSLSSALLCIGKELPQEALSLGFHFSLLHVNRVLEEVPELLSAGIEISEQVVMAIALANAKTAFSSVITEKRGRDVTKLLGGLCEHKGLARFLETWGVVQCGVISIMISQLIFASHSALVDIPTRESIKLLGELIK